MPQFDAVAFIPVTFWLAILFVVFYVFCAGRSLPFIAGGLKTRFKYMYKGDKNLFTTTIPNSLKDLYALTHQKRN